MQHLFNEAEGIILKYLPGQLPYLGTCITRPKHPPLPPWFWLSTLPVWFIHTGGHSCMNMLHATHVTPWFHPDPPPPPHMTMTILSTSVINNPWPQRSNCCCICTHISFDDRIWYVLGRMTGKIIRGHLELQSLVRTPLGYNITHIFNHRPMQYSGAL